MQHHHNPMQRAEPRALVLSEGDRKVLTGRLAKALLRFQERALHASDPKAILCQVRNTAARAIPQPAPASPLPACGGARRWAAVLATPRPHRELQPCT